MKKMLALTAVSVILLLVYYRNQSQPVATSTQKTETQTTTISENSPKKETKQTTNKTIVSTTVQGQLLMGTVYDWFSKEPIPNVLVYRDQVNIGSTNEKGSFKVNTSPYQELEFSADGYAHETLMIQEHHYKGNPGIFLYPNTGGYSGEVQDFQEKPIAGATVNLLTKEGAQAVMETDLQGHYSFQALKLNQHYKLSVTHPLYEQKLVNLNKLVKPENTHKIIQLKPRRSVYGRILSQTKKPIAHLDLQLFEKPYAKASILTQTDKDGNFRFDLDTNARSYLFFVSSTPYSIAQNITVPSNHDLDMGTIVLKEGHPIKGYVFNEQNEPLENAEVMVIPAHFKGDPTISTTFTLSNGAFETIHFPLDTALVLKVKAKGFKTLTKSITSPLEEQNIILEPVYSFKVQVLDPQENPITRATVRLIKNQIERFFPTKDIVEDDHGIAVFENVAAGEYSLLVNAPGMRAKLTSITVATSVDLYTIKLEEGASIWGYALDKNNKPVSEAYVQAKQDKGLPFFMSYMLKQSIYTDANGFYFIDYLKPDLVRMEAKTYVASGGLHAQLQLGTNHHDLQLIKKKGNYSISGQVVNQNNQPLADVLVRAHFLQSFEQAYSDANGFFTIDHLKPMDYKVSDTDDRSNIVDVTITNESITNVILVLKPKKQLFGKVTGVAPEEMNKVEILPFNSSQFVSVDRDGNFVIKDLDSKKYQIAAIHNEKKLRATASIDLSKDDPTPTITLDLKPALQHEFKITINGNPVANTEVNLNGHLIREKKLTDEHGHVIFKNLSPGTYYLWLPQGDFDYKELTITDDGFSEIDFQSFKLSGYVLDKYTEKPIPGASLRVSTETTYSDDQGYFSFDGLNKSFILVVAAENYTRKEFHFDKEKDEVTTILLEPANHMVFQLLPPIGMTYADMDRDLLLFAYDENTGSSVFDRFVPDANGNILVDNLPEITSAIFFKWSPASKFVHNINTADKFMQVQLIKDGNIKLPPLNTTVNEVRFTFRNLELNSNLYNNNGYPKEGKTYTLPVGNYRVIINWDEQEWTTEIELKSDETIEIPAPILEKKLNTH